MDSFDITKYAEKADRKQVNPDGVCNIYIRSRSKIQSTQSRFKLIGFMNSKKEQIGKPIRDEEFITYLADTPVILNDNGLVFKNNIEYAWAKFM